MLYGQRAICECTKVNMKSTNLDHNLMQQLFDSRVTTFWKHALSIDGSVTPHVIPNVIIMGAVASAICAASWLLLKTTGIMLSLPVAPFEFIGAALGLLLVLRTNAGYDRWWEGRKLWGGIVNQSRNLAISGLTYGPKDAAWQDEFVRWVASFPYVSCATLRDETTLPEVEDLVGKEAAAELCKANHMPSFVAQKLALLLRESYESLGMDRFAFMQADRERALLIDHLGACERIKATPLAFGYSVKIRRFIAIFLLTLPLALLHTIGHNLLIPAITMLVAYPLFALDQLGLELQNPFSVDNLDHLPLTEISKTIEHNVMSLKQPQSESPYGQLERMNRDVATALDTVHLGAHS